MLVLSDFMDVVSEKVFLWGCLLVCERCLCSFSLWLVVVVVEYSGSSKGSPLVRL